VNRAGIRLAATRALKIYSGEGGRILAFSALHILISLVIGMISTVVDALTVGRTDGEGAYLLYGVSAVILAVVGYGYAGVTDRSDKRRVLTRVLVASAAICLVAAGILVTAGPAGPPGAVLSGLFVWRFLVGIILLMVFWDMTPFYFNARQGKRLFPLLAIGGAVGYSGGSLVAGLFTGVLPAWVMLLIIGAATIGAVAWFQVVRRDYAILDSPRYRDRSIGAEVREGFDAFRSNAFLRAVGLNTVLFGVLSGLIVFTYNAVVTARTAGTAGAAEVMGLQRAAVTILQATVLTKVLSQTAVGGRSGSSILQQALFLVLGTAAFIISMVGVADFTRQIEVALMSPAAIAAFAFLPARYRGRVMVLNNMVAAAFGILIATIFVALVAPMVQPLWFAYPIIVLMVVRIAFGALLNRRYTALLSESIVSDRKLNLSRIDENTANIIHDEALVQRLRDELAGQNESVRVFVLTRLVRAVQTRDEIDRIASFFGELNGSLAALWIETLARVDYDAYRDAILRGTTADDGTVRVAANVAVLSAAYRAGETDSFRSRVDALSAELAGAVSETRFREIVDLLLRLEVATGEAVFDLRWRDLSDSQRGIVLERVAIHPTPRLFPTLQSLLGDTEWASSAVAALAALPPDFLLRHRGEWSDAPTEVRLEILRTVQDPVLRREDSADLLVHFLSEEDPFDTLLAHREALIDVALFLLADTDPISPALTRVVREGYDRFAGLLPELFHIRFIAEDAPEEVRPISRKLTREYLHLTASAVLLLRSLTLPREEDRVLAYSVCREITERAAVVHHNAMEFIETRVEGDAKTYLLTYFESMTTAEKRVRLRSLLKDRIASVAAIIAEKRAVLSARGDEIGVEVLEYLETTAVPSGSGRSLRR
jgi:AAA family ATP:ADP antiporter